MKKISFILLSALFIGAYFIVVKSTQIQKSSDGFNLTRLCSINNAAAEVNQDGEVEDEVNCTFEIIICTGNTCYSKTTDGTKTDCVKGPGKCTPTSCGL